MSSPALREAARAALLDDRVLLLRYEENGGFWATPGGSLEPGEALARELREELGAQQAELGPLLATRTTDHLVAGRPARQVEQYYLVRVRAGDIRPEHATRTDNIQGSRWWTPLELRDTDQTVYPAGLSVLIDELLISGPPAVPRTLG